MNNKNNPDLIQEIGLDEAKPRSRPPSTSSRHKSGSDETDRTSGSGNGNSSVTIKTETAEMNGNGNNVAEEQPVTQVSLLFTP